MEEVRPLAQVGVHLGQGGLDDDTHLPFGGDKLFDLRILGRKGENLSLGRDRPEGDQLFPDLAVAEGAEAHSPRGHPSGEGPALAGRHAEEG